MIVFVESEVDGETQVRILFREVLTMRDNDVRAAERRFADQPWEFGAIGIGAVAGAFLGMLFDGPGLAGVGGVLGAGVGWGVGNELRDARDRSLFARFSLALGGAFGGVLLWIAGALTGWPIVAMLGIAFGVSLGTVLTRRATTR